MATLLIDRVAHRLGQSAAANTNFPTKAMIVNSLNEGAIESVRRLTSYAIPEHIKESAASASKTNGLAIPSDFIKEVQIYGTTDYVNVRRVPIFIKHLLKSSSSMHYATESNPAYYFRNSRIIVEPSVTVSGNSYTIVYVAEPTACISTTNEGFASWNKYVEELAIDYGVIRGKESQSGDTFERFKTALALAKTRAVSAVSSIGNYNFSISAFASCVSSLDSVTILPAYNEFSVSNLSQTMSISSVSYTAPSILSISSVSRWTDTRILKVLNYASRAVSILTTQITGEDFEKGNQYILQSSEYLKQAAEEISNENGKLNNFNFIINKVISTYQSDITKLAGIFSAKLERATAQSNFDKSKYDSKHQYSIEFWSQRVQRGINKINAQISKYQTWLSKEVDKNKLLLEKANAKIQSAQTETQIAGVYLQNNVNLENEAKMLEEQYIKRIESINVKFGRSG